MRKIWCFQISDMRQVRTGAFPYFSKPYRGIACMATL